MNTVNKQFEEWLALPINSQNNMSNGNKRAARHYWMSGHAAALAGCVQGEPVAWLHNDPDRLDVIHHKAKELWLKAWPKQVEHYTISLYTQAGVPEDAPLTQPCANQRKGTRMNDDNERFDNAAVNGFATAMKEKLAAKRAQGYGGWADTEQCSTLRLSNMLKNHVEKGDPVDVANFAMMIYNRHAKIDNSYLATRSDHTKKLEDRCTALQAQIDRLMLEYCPDEMTPEQVVEWENHQVAVPEPLQALADQAQELDMGYGKNACTTCGRSEFDAARLRRLATVMGCADNIPETDAELGQVIGTVIGILIRQFDHLSKLDDTIATKNFTEQQALLNKCACLLADSHSEDGLDPDEAQELIEAIDGNFSAVGITSTESAYWRLYQELCKAAGVNDDDEIAPLDAIKIIVNRSGSAVQCVECQLIGKTACPEHGAPSEWDSAIEAAALEAEKVGEEYAHKDRFKPPELCMSADSGCSTAAYRIRALKKGKF